MTLQQFRRHPAPALLGLLCAVALVAGGCAAGNERFDTGPAGFWAGLWHGAIVLFTFVISLFNEAVRIYEPHNTGHLYDLGFVLGMLIVYGGSKAKGRRKKD